MNNKYVYPNKGYRLALVDYCYIKDKAKRNITRLEKHMNTAFEIHIPNGEADGGLWCNQGYLSRNLTSDAGCYYVISEDYIKKDKPYKIVGDINERIEVITSDDGLIVLVSTLHTTCLIKG